MPALEHVKIPMSDGVRLSAYLVLPDAPAHPGPWPAILEALPYRKDDITSGYKPEYERLADEGGYAVCRIDVRGTGSSEGIAVDEYPVREQDDLIEVIRWLAEQPWSTGDVGMYGTSYSGFNAIQVAMRRPPQLKAIIPIFATDDRFGDDVHYYGGAQKQLDKIDYPAYMVAMNALPPAPPVYGEGWREVWEQRVQETEPWLITWLEHQRLDDYWKHGSLLVDYDSIEAATMIVAGWADGYRNNSLRTIQQLTCPKRLLLGPWAHASIEDSDPGPNIDIVVEHLRWWDRWLKGIDNGIDGEPEIVVFARRSTRPSPTLKEYRGEWRYEPGWPLERLVETQFELEKARAPGRNDTGPDDLQVRGDVGWTAWISCAGALPWGTPDDQRADEAFSLVYDWEPLEDELEILGHPTLEVTVTSSAPIAYLDAKLCDVFPDGTSSLVTRGLLNLAHRDSREEPTPIEPGRPYRISFPLEVTSWIFERGHRIRLDLAGTDWPNAWPPPEPLSLTIDRVGSMLTLPVLDGPSPISERPTMAEPRREQHVGGRHGGSSGGTDASGGDGEGRDDAVWWRIEHDQLARETRAVAGSSGVTQATDDRPRVDEIYEGHVAVSYDDPGRARAEGHIRFEIAWPEVTATSELTHKLVSDREAYHLEMDLVVSENGEQRWTRRWRRRIPRDHA
ncbi:MAG: CocE/NonD family hydrolase [Actinomycetota bacterium]